jgi:uncharacterized membrane protein
MARFFRPINTSQQPALLERVMAALCYLSMGFVGLLYLILAGRNQPSSWFRFHFLQSILLGILSFLIGWTGSMLATLVGGIVGTLHAGFVGDQVLIVTINTVKLFSQLMFLLMAYGLVFALLGKEANIPLISNLVRDNLR